MKKHCSAYNKVNQRRLEIMAALCGISKMNFISALLCIMLSIFASCSGKSSKQLASGNLAESPAKSQNAAEAAVIPLQFLQDLPLTQMDALEKRTLAQMQKHLNTPDAEKIFIEYFKDYRSLAERVDKRIIRDTSLSEKLVQDEQVADALQKALNPHGIELMFSEGMPYADISNDYLLRIFGLVLSPAMGEYLNLCKAEQKAPYLEDAGLLVSWDKYSDRIITWEKLLSAHPDFVWYEEARQRHSSYLDIFLTGVDNTPIFDEGHVLIPEVKKSYQRFLQLYAGTKSAEFLRDYYKVLEETEFRNGPLVEEFLRMHKVDSILTRQK
jgi:hypothetical protein